MDITMGLPTWNAHGRDEELAWYRKIDEGPWDGLSTWDRFTWPVGWSLIVQLSAAAAMTERVKLWTNIANLPPRNPVLFAKDIATVDVLSAGRVMFGVGIGFHEEDYLAVGSDFGLRRQRLDSHIATMKRIWQQEPPVEGHLPVGPAPVQPGGIPIIAGVSGPKALARAAKWATGVNDPGQTSIFDGIALAAQRERVVEAWRDAGRTEPPHFSTCVYFALGEHAESRLKDHLYAYSIAEGEDIARGYAETATNFGPEGLRRAVNGARDIGLDDVLLIPITADPTEIDRAREALGI